MATISAYETAKGKRYRVRYRTPQGKQTDKRGFLTKRAAETFATTIEARKLDGTFIAHSAGQVTVAEVAESWLARRVHTKPSWQTRQESMWRIHVEPEWGERAVGSIGRPEVKDWIAAMTQAPSTITDIHGVLAAILDEAVDERLIAANPARGVKLPRREAVDHDYLTHAQVRLLADEVSRHREIVMLLAYSGLRWGEMAALRPRDVDLKKGRIDIVRSASKVNSESIIVAPKTWERRTVAIPTEVSRLLTPIVKAAPTKDSLLWSRPDGTPLRPPTTTHWLMKAVARLVAASTKEDPFPRVTAHELRHTAASLMIASGAHVKTVQRQLGHKSATMTLDLYGHLFDDDLDAVAAGMGKGLRLAAVNGELTECGQNVGTDGAGVESIA